MEAGPGTAGPWRVPRGHGGGALAPPDPRARSDRKSDSTSSDRALIQNRAGLLADPDLPRHRPPTWLGAACCPGRRDQPAGQPEPGTDAGGNQTADARQFDVPVVPRPDRDVAATRPALPRPMRFVPRGSVMPLGTRQRLSSCHGRFRSDHRLATASLFASGAGRLSPGTARSGARLRPARPSRVARGPAPVPPDRPSGRPGPAGPPVSSRGRDRLAARDRGCRSIHR